ncbi:MAG TPA: hypothetical protein VNA19_11090 [Pyrinomonadaceae bacterium]|jgi:hypothetical protein|nr:hypothetical protein [Pyrinomonadaceae bacterium]
MSHHIQTRFTAVVVFPLVLLLFVQGGSCRSSSGGASGRNNNNAANSRNTNNADAASVNAVRTSPSPTQTKETPNVKEVGAGGTVPAGEWGGAHVGLTVTASGGRIEFDCAHGSIDGKLSLDAEGRFSVAGSFVKERGGPVRIDEKPDSSPARYSGRVEGKKMTLTLVLTDSGEDLGTFTLTRGESPHLTKCL